MLLSGAVSVFPIVILALVLGLVEKGITNRKDASLLSLHKSKCGECKRGRFCTPATVLMMMREGRNV